MEHALRNRRPLRRQVLIPCRDSLFMERTPTGLLASQAQCFNPLEGFFMYGTRMAFPVPIQPRCFNPLEGFFMYGTRKIFTRVHDRGVLIPWRDSLCMELKIGYREDNKLLF